MEQTAWTGVMMDGLPGEMLLVLAFLLWMVFGLILVSNPRNPLNQWCFASGMLFSVGALKEFIFIVWAPSWCRRGSGQPHSPMPCIRCSALCFTT